MPVNKENGRNFVLSFLSMNEKEMQKTVMKINSCYIEEV